jgi:predicted TPR repeat methyltransferase
VTAASPAGIPQALQAAFEHYQAGRLAEAEALYREVVRLDPAHADAHANLGATLRRRGEPAQAIAACKKALSLNPAHGRACHHIANALLDQGRTAEAVPAYRQAIALEPQAADSYNNLAVALRDLGNIAEATECCRQALRLAPDYADALATFADLLLRGGNVAEAAAAARRAAGIPNRARSNERALGRLLARCGLRDDARMLFEACLDRDPQDREGIRVAMAQLGLAAAPAAASPAFLEAMYERRSRDWDRSAAHLDKYRAPRLVAERFLRLPPAAAKPEILDAGCGTGLLGALVRDAASRLAGIDLSRPMLEQARAKHLYDELFQEDLVAFMSLRTRSYDVVLSAATFIHFGDLRPVHEAAANALRDGGWLIFTVFPLAAGADFSVAAIDGLALSGCFAHSRDYLARVAGASDFELRSMENVIHEYVDGRPVDGLVVALQRKASP